MSFLPKDYNVPEKPGNYMRLEQGENKIRILSSPILGRVWWVREDGTIKTGEDKPIKGDKPIRREMDKDITGDEFEVAKHFWAMVVWNYRTETVQILEITQSTIQKPLKALAEDEDWGDPKGIDGYDITITRSGEKLETEYQTQPKPKKKIDEGIVKMAKDMDIKLEALFKGEDPFAKEEEDLASEAVEAGL